MSFIEGYEAGRVLGEGAFAIVREFRNRQNGQRIAVKNLRSLTRDNSEYQARFEREIEILLSLRDVDGVVQILGHSETLSGPDTWYSMPVAASHLHRFIKRNNADLDENSRVTIMKRVLGAIQAAHERGILHRDICPPNILVIDSERCDSVVVADFGLGRDVNSMATRTRSSVDKYGQAYYVAPEQRESLKAATVQSDIFSLGKLLNFVMTGKDPDHHHECSYSPVIKRATNPDPDKRHATVDRLIEHFDRIVTVRTEPEIEREVLEVALSRSENQPQWERLHPILIEPQYPDHVYYGYLEPVLKFFAEDSRLRSYSESVGNDLSQFVAVFLDKMRECMSSLGWPFSETGRFASFLERVFQVSEDSETRGQCLIGMWEVAFGADQWDAQRSTVALLMSGKVDENAAVELADFIMEEKITIDDERLRDPRIPMVIRNSIDQVGDAS